MSRGNSKERLGNTNLWNKRILYSTQFELVKLNSAIVPFVVGICFAHISGFSSSQFRYVYISQFKNLLVLLLYALEIIFQLRNTNITVPETSISPSLFCNVALDRYNTVSSQGTVSNT